VVVQSTEVTLAVAVRDIDWMKETMKDIRDGVKTLQQREEQYATKKEVDDLRKEVDKLKGWRNWIMGAIALGGFVVGTASKWKWW